MHLVLYSVGAEAKSTSALPLYLVACIADVFFSPLRFHLQPEVHDAGDASSPPTIAGFVPIPERTTLNTWGLANHAR